jgi:ferrous iron transport protein B
MGKIMRTLDKIKKGETVKVISIEDSSDEMRSHIFNMGLTPGVEVTLLKKAPLGDPLEFRLRGYELALQKKDASKIVVGDPIEQPHVSEQIDFEIEKDHPQIGEEIRYIDQGRNPKKTKIKFALVGNQNAGKSTLFNKLTGSHQHVGNFPGVTVEKTEGIIKGNPDLSITDLPGVYSLSPYSKEEIITREFILNEKPDGIINIVDATNIERNLLLTIQLLELNIPVVIALNMMDEVQASSWKIDINGLEKFFGVPVIPISALKNEGISELVEHAANIAKYEDLPKKLDLCEKKEGKEGAVHRCIHSIMHLVSDRSSAEKIPLRFAATKFLENDEWIKKSLRLDKNQVRIIEKQISQMEDECKMDSTAALADMRFSFIEKICRRFVFKPQESRGFRLSSRLDKILTGKYTAFPAFFCIIAAIMYVTFGPVGSFLSQLMEGFTDFATTGIDHCLTSYGLNSAVHSLIVDGICVGVGSVLSFLPMILVLFFFLSLLEDTGYMARVAFVMDRALRKIGLSGRSFVPMLIGFGCSVPAIMAARTLPSERDRKMTVLLTPFMSCSAKLTIYAFFTAAFFKENQVVIVISLYIIGIIVGIVFALIMKALVFKGNPVPFIMELPNYRFPSLVNIRRLIFMKAKDFVTQAFTVIFFATIVVWFLQAFDSRLDLVDTPADSMLAELGSSLSPIFAPLGMDDWRISTAFISGFTAKESVISTLNILMSGNALQQAFTPLTAFVFLVFCLLYTPCIAAIAAVKRELGKRYALGVVFLQCAIAWVVSFCVYKAGTTILLDYIN